MSEIEEREIDTRARIARIIELLSQPACSDYNDLTQNLDELAQTVKQEVAARLEPALKSEVHKIECESYEDKQRLTKWLTGELRKYGLTLQWKATEEIEGLVEERTYEAHVVTDVGNNAKGRFQVRYRDVDGKLMKPLSTPKLSVFLDHFKVMVDDPDRHRFGKWTDRVAHRGENERG